MSSFFPIITISLGISAGLVQIIGYFLYLGKINIGRIKPNTASWTIWAFGAVLESVSYIFVTGDWVKNILPVACALSAVLIFIYCLKNGHFSKPSRFEWLIIFLDCIAIFVWWWYSSAVYANFLLIITAVISFLPIILHVCKDPTVEDARPWFVWTSAYFIMTIVVFLRWEKWEDLIYPIVFLLLHALIGYLSLDSRRL